MKPDINNVLLTFGAIGLSLTLGSAVYAHTELSRVTNESQAMTTNLSTELSKAQADRDSVLATYRKEHRDASVPVVLMTTSTQAPVITKPKPVVAKNPAVDNSAALAKSEADLKAAQDALLAKQAADAAAKQAKIDAAAQAAKDAQIAADQAAQQQAYLDSLASRQSRRSRAS